MAQPLEDPGGHLGPPPKTQSGQYFRYFYFPKLQRQRSLVCAVGGWRFAQLAVCAQICCEFVTQSAETQSVARWAICAVGGLHGGRFA